MYINPFLAGVIGTLLFELVCCIVYAARTQRKR